MERGPASLTCFSFSSTLVKIGSAATSYAFEKAAPRCEPSVFTTALTGALIGALTGAAVSGGEAPRYIPASGPGSTRIRA